MGKYDVDFDDYDEKSGTGYDGPTPTKGTFDGVLVSLKEHTSGTGNEGLEWQFDITEGDFKGWRGWVYSNMDTTKWRTQEITKAIQGGSESKMSLDPAESGGDGTASKTVKKAMPVRLRLIRETYEGEPRAKIRNVMPSEAGAAKKEKKSKKKKGDDPF